jgi:hypothetical protein
LPPFFKVEMSLLSPETFHTHILRKIKDQYSAIINQ